MYCGNCGTKLPEDARFCAKCGKPIDVMQSLIDRAKSNDSTAQTELYERTYKIVYSRIRAKISDDDAVMDIMQESYLRAFTNLDQLQDADHFTSWLVTIANRQTCDWYRKNGKELENVQLSQLEYEDDDTVSDEDDLLDQPEYREDFSPDESLDRAETGRLLSEILDTLPEDQRIILTMRYYDEMSLQEISDELGVNLSTVKSRLTAGKKKVEAKVRELEKSGTKLYSLGPVAFLVYLLHHAELFAPALPANTIIGMTAAGAGTAVGGAVAGSTAVGTATQAAAGVTGKAAAGTAVKAAGGAAAKGIGAKIAAAVAAAVIVAGGITTAVIVSNNQNNQETAEVIETEKPSQEVELPSETGVSATDGASNSDATITDDVVNTEENEDGPNYIMTLSQLNNDMLVQLESEANSWFYVDEVPRWREEYEGPEGFEYIGCYLLTPQKDSEEIVQYKNILFLLYETEVVLHNYHDDGTQYDEHISFNTAYFFNDVAISPTGVSNVEYSSCGPAFHLLIVPIYDGTQDNEYNANRNLPYYGYSSVEDFVERVTDDYKGLYEIETNVS